MTSRKHYEHAARIIRDITDLAIRHSVAIEFADMFQWDNPRFVRDTFLKACDVVEVAQPLLVFAEEM